MQPTRRMVCFTRCKRVLLIAGLAATLFASAVLAQGGPVLIPFQGRLADGAGAPVADGVYEVHFSLWDALVGGTKLWEESHLTVSVIGGRVNVLLGAIVPALGTVDFNEPRFLGLTVVAVSNQEMAPRHQLVPSFYARNADTLDGRDSTEFADASHDHSGDEIVSGIIDESRIDADIARDSELGILWDGGADTTSFIGRSGNVAIGTTSPSSDKLHVAGNARVTGSITASSSSLGGLNASSAVIDNSLDVGGAATFHSISISGNESGLVCGEHTVTVAGQTGNERCSLRQPNELCVMGVASDNRAWSCEVPLFAPGRARCCRVD